MLLKVIAVSAAVVAASVFIKRLLSKPSEGLVPHAENLVISCSMLVSVHAVLSSFVKSKILGVCLGAAAYIALTLLTISTITSIKQEYSWKPG